MSMGDIDALEEVLGDADAMAFYPLRSHANKFGRVDRRRTGT